MSSATYWSISFVIKTILKNAQFGVLSILIPDDTILSQQNTVLANTKIFNS